MVILAVLAYSLKASRPSKVQQSGRSTQHHLHKLDCLDDMAIQASSVSHV